MKLKEVGWECVNWFFWLRKGSSAGLLNLWCGASKFGKICSAHRKHEILYTKWSLHVIACITLPFYLSTHHHQ